MTPIDLRKIQLPGSDMHGALQRLGGNQALLLRLLQSFCVSHSETGARLRSLVAEDPEGARHLAHNLKGTAASVGLEALSATAASLEFALKQGDAPAPALDAVEASLGQVLLALAAAGVNSG